MCVCVCVCQIIPYSKLLFACVSSALLYLPLLFIHFLFVFPPSFIALLNQFISTSGSQKPTAETIENIRECLYESHSTQFRFSFFFFLAFFFLSNLSFSILCMAAPNEALVIHRWVVLADKCSSLSPIQWTIIWKDFLSVWPLFFHHCLPVRSRSS